MTKDQLKASIQAAFHERARWAIAPTDGQSVVLEMRRTDAQVCSRHKFGTDREAREFIWQKVMQAAVAGLIRSGGQLEQSHVRTNE